jgi:hypothetical protein
MGEHLQKSYGRPADALAQIFEHVAGLTPTIGSAVQMHRRERPVVRFDLDTPKNRRARTCRIADGGPDLPCFQRFDKVPTTLAMTQVT